MKIHITLVLILISGIYPETINRKNIWGVPGLSLEVQSGMDMYKGNIGNYFGPAFSIGGNLGAYLGVFGIKPGIDFAFGKNKGPDTISGVIIGNSRNAVRRSFNLTATTICPFKFMYVEPYVGAGFRDYFINLVKGSSDGFQSGFIPEYKMGIEIGIPIRNGTDGFKAIAAKIGDDYYGGKENKFKGHAIYFRLSYCIKGWMVNGK